MCEQLDPEASAAGPTSSSADVSTVDPYTGAAAVDPYTGGQSANPYTGQVSVAPPDSTPTEPNASFTGEPSGTPFESSAVDTASSGGSDATGLGAGAAMGGAVDPSTMSPEELAEWNEYLKSDVSTYDFEASDEAIASARYDAKVNAFEDFSESVQSGTYSPRATATMDNITPDTATEISDAWESGQSYAKFTGEPGAISPVDSSDVPSIQNDPINPENSYLNDPASHFENDHLSDYSNDPGDYANPNADVNAEMDAEFGEGSFIQNDGVASQLETNPIGANSQAGTDFLAENGYAADGTSLAGDATAAVDTAEVVEGTEAVVTGTELVEGGVVAAEVGVEFEAADLLILVIFL